MADIKIIKGHDIILKGSPRSEVVDLPKNSRVGVMPNEFDGIRPKLLVNEGDHVNVGSPLFIDRKHPEIQFLSPGSGTISGIIRGNKRVLEKIIIIYVAIVQYIKLTY